MTIKNQAAASVILVLLYFAGCYAYMTVPLPNPFYARQALAAEESAGGSAGPSSVRGSASLTATVTRGSFLSFLKYDVLFVDKIGTVHLSFLLVVAVGNMVIYYRSKYRRVEK